ncbi:MAG: tyrosine-type recombinase/integrase [Planctomycetota bacterium]
MTARKKPKKPYPDFPLFPHASGRWAKKIRQKFCYFGPVTADPDHGAMAALEKYQAVAADLHAGRTPRVQNGDGLTVADLCNRFMTAKTRTLDAGEIVHSTFANYLRCCRGVVDFFGRTRLVTDLTADDFEQFRAELAKTKGPSFLALEITEVRVLFKYAYDRGLIDTPVRYGQSFNKPSQRVLRKNRAEGPSKMFEPAELRQMIDAADQPLKAFVHLGLNAAFGPADIAGIPRKAIDLKTGWLVYARPKTGLDRRIPLWGETVAAVEEAWSNQPASPSHEHSAFVTSLGTPWASRDGKSSLITMQFRRLLRSLELYRPGVGFYSLRHVFRTVADETLDFPAVNLIMGHVDRTMGATYRERIADERLVAVTEHVRRWLFSPGA